MLRYQINIIGLKWNITISDYHISLGYEIKTIKEWKKINISSKWLKENYPEEIEWWKMYKKIILDLIKNRI